ncbi:MAG: hypothetical protein A2X45_16500 [Lentisphaerae bacterium GWF2_50_93]|nr:MAG: hypothetical protein A2X45_16500 [Lentisphaerae bacterium GWF2_50_93]
MDNNRVIAGLLRQIGALHEEKGVPFKPAAYRHAAQVIEDLPRDVSTCVGKKELMKLPGIGDAIADKILEYLETGKIEALQKLIKKQGGLPAELMQVEDLGPKRVRQLQKELGVTTVPALIKAAREGKLRLLPGFSEQMEMKILENAGRVTECNTRFPRRDIIKDVEMLLKTIRALPDTARCEAAGSYRRKKETIGDVDILVVANPVKKVSAAICRLPSVRDVVAHGVTKLSFDLKSGLRVDVRLVDENQWGAALLYFTGPKEHNIALRKRAIAKGWKLNEYGLYNGDEIIAQREEKDVYEALGLKFYEPHARSEML